MCQPHLEHYNILFKMWLTHGTHLAWRYFAKISENTFFKMVVESDTNEMTLPGMILIFLTASTTAEANSERFVQIWPFGIRMNAYHNVHLLRRHQKCLWSFQGVTQKNKQVKQKSLFVCPGLSVRPLISSSKPAVQMEIVQIWGKSRKKQPFIFDCPRTLSRSLDSLEHWALRMEPGWKR